MDKVIAFFKHANQEGLLLPFAKDSARPGKPPSVTLFFLYLTNILAVLSLVCLHFRTDAITATVATCGYGIVWSVLYLMRNLQKVKFDADDKSLELEGEDEPLKEDK